MSDEKARMRTIIANGVYTDALEIELSHLRNIIRRCQRLAEHCKEDVVPSSSRSQLKEIVTLCRGELRRSYNKQYYTAPTTSMQVSDSMSSIVKPNTDYPDIGINERVRLINPGGFNNYCGTVRKLLTVTDTVWAVVDWDCDMSNICGKQVELCVLEPLGERRT